MIQHGTWSGRVAVCKGPRFAFPSEVLLRAAWFPAADRRPGRPAGGLYGIGMSCSSTLAHRHLVGRVAWMRPIRSGWSRSIRGPHRCRRHGSTRPLIA